MTENTPVVDRLIVVISTLLDGPTIRVHLDRQGRGITINYDLDGVVPILPWQEVLHLIRAHADGRTYSWVDDDGQPVLRVHRYGTDGDEHAVMVGIRQRSTILVSADEWDRLVGAVGAVTLRQVAAAMEPVA